MSANLVKVNLHHDLGKEVGETWDLSVKSVQEAIRAIESITQKLYRFLIEKDKAGAKYQIIINGHLIDSSNISPDNIDSIKNSELCIKHSKLETIDIIPVIEGANSKTLGTVLGFILIIVGAFLAATGIGGGIGYGLIIAGLGLIVSSLLAKPPKFEDFREIDQGGKTSYLYNGPANIIGEGGPVPVLFGELIVGSQTITASYVIRQFTAGNSSDFYNDIY